MGQIKVRQLDDWIVGVHQDMAKLAGQSLEQHLREMLRQAALSARQQFAGDAAEHLKKAEARYGVLPNSVATLRELRESM